MRPIKASTGARSPTSAVRSRAGTACCRQVAGGSAPHLAERSPSLPGSPPTASRAYATSPFDSHRSRRRDWRRGRPAVRTPRGGGRRQWRGDLRRNARSARGRAAATAQEQEAQPGDRRTSQHCAMLPRPGRPGSETCRGPNGSPHASGETSQVRPFFPRGYDDTRRWPMYRNQLGDQLGNWRSGSSLNAEAVEEAIDDALPGRMELIAATAKDTPGEAFADFVALMSFLNAAVVIRASILEKVADHVEKLRDALVKIAKGLRADSFNISVNVPVGLSVSMTFKVEPGRSPSTRRPS